MTAYLTVDLVLKHFDAAFQLRCLSLFAILLLSFITE
ncbi:murein transglycosylase [Vibrio natriegens]|nr:murein transglycosylase [Vibrio sp. dhg]NVC93760.1 murein transglycosylase [Vibrio natriegens]